MKRITWPAASPQASEALTPRDDVLTEEAGSDGTFEQAHGPFHRYRRVVEVDSQEVRETITYAVRIPWFGWLFARPLRHAAAQHRHLGTAQSARRARGGRHPTN